MGKKHKWIESFSFISLNKFKKEIDQILIAIPSLKKEKLKFLINWISNQNVKVYKVPSLEDITKGRTNILDLKPISVEQILGRDSSTRY